MAATTTGTFLAHVAPEAVGRGEWEMGTSVERAEAQPSAGLQSSAPPDVADILNAVADHLETPGAWLQGRYSLGDCFCVAGAILHGPDPYLRRQAYFAFKRHIGGRRVEAWNDAPERTQAEVVAALRAAALSSEAQSPTSAEGRTGKETLDDQ